MKYDLVYIAWLYVYLKTLSRRQFFLQSYNCPVYRFHVTSR